MMKYGKNQEATWKEHRLISKKVIQGKKKIILFLRVTINWKGRGVSRGKKQQRIFSLKKSYGKKASVWNTKQKFEFDLF